ncbi:MAG: ribbon-helix-helix protein, CopG family [Chloroflexota bacterium]|nr:ribbon-helix-helix protein, CopG family [Chloroflexota bacterium]
MASAPTTPAATDELVEVTVSLPADVLREIDQLAAEKERTRSFMLTAAARRFLFSEERWRALQASAAEHAQRAGLLNENDIEEYLDSLEDEPS